MSINDRSFAIKLANNNTSSLTVMFEPWASTVTLETGDVLEVEFYTPKGTVPLADIEVVEDGWRIEPSFGTNLVVKLNNEILNYITY
ncbi:hypothetical protein GCM10008938_52170 [Deinococcus roseus]|uniref:Uncharacterized protein n=1 Tax=Deinococcus roseus TaxID=392414 RepID=A0ABQ2DJA6_9DEIO|nr:hypothetical protein GCM10008938_52170 [Deinococcus roseus]